MSIKRKTFPTTSEGVAVNELAGYRDHTRARTTGTLVVLVDAEPAGISPADGGRWALICDPHGGLLQCDRQADALGHLFHPEQWCPYCMGDEVRAGYEPEPEPTVTFVLSGTTERLIREGGWSDENPAAWAAVLAGDERRTGRATVRAVTLGEGAASSLADYLLSLADVLAVGEGADHQEARAARRTLGLIEKALGKAAA